MNKIQFTLREISLINLEHRSQEFRQINPNMKVPAITDVDTNGVKFNLSESHAILRYLHDRYGTADHWYPKDPIKRAKVNEYLDWHHSALR